MSSAHAIRRIESHRLRWWCPLRETIVVTVCGWINRRLPPSRIIELGGANGVTEQSEPKARWQMSLGSFTVTLAQLVFLAFMAGIFSERMEQVSKALSGHVSWADAINAPTRLATLEAQTAAERREREQMKQEILIELRRLNDRLDRGNGHD